MEGRLVRRRWNSAGLIGSEPRFGFGASSSPSFMPLYIGYMLRRSQEASKPV